MQFRNSPCFTATNLKSSQQFGFKAHKIYDIAVRFQVDRIKIMGIKNYSFLSQIPSFHVNRFGI